MNALPKHNYSPLNYKSIREGACCWARCYADRLVLSRMRHPHVVGRKPLAQTLSAYRLYQTVQITVNRIDRSVAVFTYAPYAMPTSQPLLCSAPGETEGHTLEPRQTGSRSQAFPSEVC